MWYCVVLYKCGIVWYFINVLLWSIYKCGIVWYFINEVLFGTL